VVTQHGGFHHATPSSAPHSTALNLPEVAGSRRQECGGSAPFSFSCSSTSSGIGAFSDPLDLPNGHASRIRIPEPEHRRSAVQDDAGDAEKLAAHTMRKEYAMRDKTTH